MHPMAKTTPSTPDPILHDLHELILLVDGINHKLASYKFFVLDRQIGMCDPSGACPPESLEAGLAEIRKRLKSVESLAAEVTTKSERISYR